jgi:hypothetical protein
LQPQPGDPVLSDLSLFVDEDAEFLAAGSGYVYRQGRSIWGENSSTYALAANSKRSGVYEAAVVVTTAEGIKLSAQCRVTFMAK